MRQTVFSRGWVVLLWAGLYACKPVDFGTGPADAPAAKLGVDPHQEVGLNSEQRQKADAIGQKVVCLCGDCPRRTVTDCSCGWAQTSKQIIRSAVARGDDEEAIISAYVDAYGLKALSVPPSTPLGQLSWMFPLLISALGLAVLLGFALRVKKRRTKAEPAENIVVSSEESDLIARELEALDDD